MARNNLKSWSQYLDLVDGDVELLPARVNARFQMARKYREMRFSNMGARTEQGYSALVAVGLAYSALEAFESLTKTSGKIIIENWDITLELQSLRFSRMFKALSIDLDKAALKRKIEMIQIGESHDVRPLAQGIRHLVFHGDATVSGMGLNPYTNQVLHDLAYEVLESVDCNFSEYVVERVNA